MSDELQITMAQAAVLVFTILLAVFYWRIGIYATWKLEDIVTVTVAIYATLFILALLIKARFR